MVEEGVDDKTIIRHLEEEYLVNEKKSLLSLEVAANENELLKTLDYKNGYSLYIGIPFCPTTCLYCSFTSYPISMWKDKVDSYLDALFKELKYLSEHLRGRRPDSIYIGGGTPTTLLPYQFERLLIFLKAVLITAALKNLPLKQADRTVLTVINLRLSKTRNRKNFNQSADHESEDS